MGGCKSFPIEQDEHFLYVCRYVERNALRAGLVRCAEGWRWSSLWQRHAKDAPEPVPLSAWPVPVPPGWLAEVNQPQSEVELERLRRSVQRGQPYGGDAWSRRMAQRLGLESTFRARGRPRKNTKVS